MLGTNKQDAMCTEIIETDNRLHDHYDDDDNDVVMVMTVTVTVTITMAMTMNDVVTMTMMMQIRDRSVAKPGCALPSTRLTSTFHLLSFAINSLLIIIIIIITRPRPPFGQLGLGGSSR